MLCSPERRKATKKVSKFIKDFIKTVKIKIKVNKCQEKEAEILLGPIQSPAARDSEEYQEETLLKRITDNLNLWHAGN